MHVATPFIATAALASGVFGAAVERRQTQESCGVKPTHVGKCGVVGRLDPPMVPFVTINSLTYDQCQTECHRNTNCGYNKFVPSSAGFGSCYFGEWNTTAPGFINDQSTGFVFTDRSCYEMTGYCDIHNGGFELKQAQDKYAHPWTFNLQVPDYVPDPKNQHKYANATVETYGTSKLGFPAPPQKSNFLAIQLRDASGVQIQQHVPWTKELSYKLFFNYNFLRFNQGTASKPPNGYNIVVEYCQEVLVNQHVNLYQGNGQWQSVVKDVKFPQDCAIGGLDQYQFFRVTVRTDETAIGPFTGLFGLDAFQLLPFQIPS